MELFASIALVLWPLVAFGVFAALGPARGLIWTVIFGYLFLPEGIRVFDLPGLPGGYSKIFVVTFASMLGVLLFRDRDPDREKISRSQTSFGTVMTLLFILLLLSTIPTYLTNNTPTVSGGRWLPAEAAWDILSKLADYIILFMPFLLAWRMINTRALQVELLYAIAWGGVIYAFLAGFEVRMSPQLNNWIYGYFPHSWIQHLRGGSYRPIVFLNHGLWVGFFLLMGLFAAIAVARDGTRMQRGWALMGALWVFAILGISSNVGALLIALLFAPVALVIGFRGQLRIAVLIAAIVLAYPLVRQAADTTITQTRDTIAIFSPDRAHSMGVRFDNEKQLLDRANLKPAFGWGGWGRSMIYNDYGRRLSIIDGYWIIQFGQTGWLGYLAFFGILTAPVFYMRRLYREREDVPIAMAGLIMIATANLIYMIPNATLTPVSMLVFGTLAAFVNFETVRSGDKTQAQAAADPRDRTPRYSRFPAGASAQHYRRS